MLECLLFVLRCVALLIKTTHAVKRISRFARTAHPVYSFASAKVSKHLSTSLQRRNVTLVRQWFQMFLNAAWMAVDMEPGVGGTAGITLHRVSPLEADLRAPVAARFEN